MSALRTFNILYSDDDGDNWDWFIRAPDAQTAYDLWVEATGVDWTHVEVQSPPVNISTMTSLEIARHGGRIMDITDINALPPGPVDWMLLPVAAWIEN